MQLRLFGSDDFNELAPPVTRAETVSAPVSPTIIASQAAKTSIERLGALIQELDPGSASDALALIDDCATAGAVTPAQDYAARRLIAIAARRRAEHAAQVAANPDVPRFPPRTPAVMVAPTRCELIALPLDRHVGLVCFVVDTCIAWRTCSRKAIIRRELDRVARLRRWAGFTPEFIELELAAVRRAIEGELALHGPVDDWGGAA